MTPARRTVLWIVGLTVVFETLTLALRFGAGLESTRDTAPLGRLTFGLRIHHSYIGALMMLAAHWLRGPWKMWTLRIGAALLASDLIHHFAVLWPVVGSPQFDLTY